MHFSIFDNMALQKQQSRVLYFLVRQVIFIKLLNKDCL